MTQYRFTDAPVRPIIGHQQESVNQFSPHQDLVVELHIAIQVINQPVITCIIFPIQITTNQNVSKYLIGLEVEGTTKGLTPF